MTHKTKIVIIISCILLAISTQIKTFVAHKTRELPPVQSHQMPTNQSTMIHAQGKWTSPQSPAYFAPYSGIIDTCYIKTGDIVTKNAPLITYDTTELTHQIQQTQLNIQAARNNHTQLHKQRYYQKKLRQNHIISKHDYDQYLTNLQGAKIKINQLSHQLNHLKNRVAKHTVKANHNGHITHLFINEGEYVLKGTHLLDVQDPTKLEIKAKINDYDAHKIQLHQTVTITSPAIPKKINGTITYIQPQIESGHHQNSLGIHIKPNTVPTGIYPGGIVTIAIHIPTNEHPSKIPTPSTINRAITPSSSISASLTRQAKKGTHYD